MMTGVPTSAAGVSGHGAPGNWASAASTSATPAGAAQASDSWVGGTWAGGISNGESWAIGTPVGGAWTGVVVVATLSLVPAAGLVLALARWRTRRGSPHPWRWSFAEVGMVVGTAPWLWMILTPSGTGRALEAVPLLGLFEQVTGDPAVAVEQIGGNLLVFAAFGLCAPLRWNVRLSTVAALACAGSLTVEALQYALAIGRVTSLDDVLLNTLGATAAAAGVRLRQVIHERRQARAVVVATDSNPDPDPEPAESGPSSQGGGVVY